MIVDTNYLELVLWQPLGHPDAGKTYPHPWNDRDGFLVQRHQARWPGDVLEERQYAGGGEFRGYSNAMAICGVAVLLLTAIAQIE